MWIIRLALKRPYTFVVAALLLLLVTPFVLLRTPTDVLPPINIPVVSIIWNFNGLSAREIEQRMVYTEERVLTTTVNDIEHIESTSYDGIGIIKVFFQSSVTTSTAVAQITAVSQTILRQLPPGTTTPLIIQYSASDVPVLQYGVGGDGISEQQAADIALNQLRVGLITVPGIAIPYPYGGKQRLVSIDLDLRKLQEKNLTQTDVTNAVNAQALVFPSGTAKLGPTQYPIDINTFPLRIDTLNDLPIKTVDGATIRVRDVAEVRDGYDPQTNIVRQDGVRSVLMVLLKNGNASTLSVVQGAKQAMANVLKTVNSAVRVTEFSDQSVFVRAAISGVVREGVIAGALTALMILLFLGSWRSTIVAAISIPLSVLASLAVLSALGETINLMTLGGLALAVGILIDDATVTIENIERHMRAGETLENAILVGAGEIALPALVSTFCIWIVFIPMFFLSGVAHYLFVPFAEAVVFAVLASYVLSRTLVPTLVMWFERNNHAPSVAAATSGATSKALLAASPSPGGRSGHVMFLLRPLVALQHYFEHGFDLFRAAYRNLLGTILNHRESSFTSQRGFRLIAVIGAAILLGALVVGFVPRLSQRKQAASDTNQLAIPSVSLVSPSTGAPPDGLMLPAEVRPWQEASIFSRVNGYLKSWLVDIGAHVEQDQLLAEIDTPDLDHQLDQARSQSTLAQGSSQLAKITNDKWQKLWHEGVVSELDADNTATNQDTTKANAEAFAANLRVLEQQVAFKRVTAPFPGIITARNTNVGDLIVANNTNMEMFHIQQTNPLRIYFRVPQANADDIRVGQSIDVVFSDLAKTLQAKVATTSESITPNSRTLLVELHLDNPNNQIQPGSYAPVRLTPGSLGQIVTLPNNTLLFRAQGLQVGVVKPDNTVELRDIKVGRDFGTMIEMVQGVTPSDKVILNPADSLVTGTAVRVAAAPTASPSPEVAKK